MSTKKEIKLLSTRWIAFSALGMLMMAAGLVVLMEGIVMRVNSSDNFDYAWVIFIAIIIFSAGISFMGTSIKYRIYLDRKRKQDNEFQSNSRSSGGEGSSSRSHHRSSRSSKTS